MTDTLVQPIAVDPCGHEETILAAALASAGLLGHSIDASTALGRRTDPTRWGTWLTGRFSNTGRFTKSVRRVRRPEESITLLAARELPALRTEVAGAVATAFEPMGYDEYPRPLKKLQVSGLDIAHRPDDALPAEHLSRYSLTPTIILNRDVSMSTGKSAAQAAHVLGLWALSLSPQALLLWLTSPGARLEYAQIDPADNDLIIVQDSGLTEIAPNTITAAIEVP